MHKRLEHCEGRQVTAQEVETAIALRSLLDQMIVSNEQTYMLGQVCYQLPYIFASRWTQKYLQRHTELGWPFCSLVELPSISRLSLARHIPRPKKRLFHEAPRFGFDRRWISKVNHMQSWWSCYARTYVCKFFKAASSLIPD